MRSPSVVAIPVVRKLVAFDVYARDWRCMLNKEVRTEPKNSTKKNVAS
jgi:hypothetical protein